MVEFFILLIVYLFPAIIANCRKHNDENAIAIMNFFLGWTVVFWFWALIWSFTGNTRHAT